MNDFAAKEPSLGYHYQIRYGLYLILQARDKDDPYIKFEDLDDVSISDINRVDLHQTKFHSGKIANLTDSSVDLWKTIRVWSEHIVRKTINLDNSLLILVTTAPVSRNSIIYGLTENRIAKVDYSTLIERLNKVTKESKNKLLAESFLAYNQLTNHQKEKLLKSIFIKDNSLAINDLKEGCKKNLKIHFIPKFLDKAYEMLEGWWYEQCIQFLQDKKDKITLEEVTSAIWDIREQLSNDSLPIDDLIREATVKHENYDKRKVVKQLTIATVGPNSVKQAISDFYKATEQRSKWVREKLLHPTEEISYDKRLISDYEPKFAVLKDNAGAHSVDVCAKECREFYNNFYALTCPQIFIRPKVTEPFIVRGSYHMLADQERIIWHPQHNKRENKWKTIF